MAIHVLAAGTLALLAAVGPAPSLAATIKNETKCWSFKASYPTTGNPSIDEDLTRWVKGLEKEFLAEARGFCTDDRCGRCGSELKYRVTRDDTEFLSIAFEDFRYMGGAYPTIYLPHRTYLKPEGRYVQIGDLLTPQGLELLSQTALAEPKLQGRGDPDSLKRGLAPVSANFESFTLSADSLTVQWCAGCLFSHAIGGLEVTIPLETVRPFFRGDLRLPAPSFDCSRAATRIEKAICDSWRLAQADRAMADQFHLECLSVERLRAISKSGPTCRDLQRDQAAWLKRRDGNCGDVPDTGVESCLLPLMEARAKALPNWGYEHSKP